MSIVIVGGNDRMVQQYKSMCKCYNCKVKVFTQMAGDMRSRIGCPDLVVLFTNTVSHKMVQLVVQECGNKATRIERCHSSSGSALKGILEQYCVNA